MQTSVRVAAVSLDSKPGATEHNLDQIARLSSRAAGAGADLVLFPELSITGFLPNHPASHHTNWLREALSDAWNTAESLAGPAARRLAAISAETGLCIAAGLLENAGNLLYNTHLLAGDGRILGYWRKMHVPTFEMQIYNGGGVPDVIDTPLGRIGVNICFDAMMPESTRLLGVQSCEIVLFPFAADPPPGTPAAWLGWAGPVVRARCAENGVFGVCANYLGTVECAGASQSFPGGAMILGPEGELIAESHEIAHQPQLLLADLTHRRLVDARAGFEYSFRFRRPELYRLLTS